jgi:hypothetical protein
VSERCHRTVTTTKSRVLSTVWYPRYPGGVAGPKTQLWTLTGNGYNTAFEILEQQEDSDGDHIGLNIDTIRASTLENPYSTAVRRTASNGNMDDAGWNDPRVLLEVAKTPDEQLVVLDEFYQSDSHVKDATAWLTHNDKPDGTIYAEHEPAESTKFKQAGATVEKAEKSIDVGISEVRKRLEPDGNSLATASSGAPPVLTWEESREKQQPREETAEQNPRVELLVSDQCQHTIREFLGYKEDHVGKGHAEDHCLDSLRYLVMGVAGGPTLVRRWAGRARRRDHRHG